MKWRLAIRDVASEATQIPSVTTPAAPALQSEKPVLLEVIGLGLGFDFYRQAEVWDAIQHYGLYSSVRQTDPMFYPWSRDEKVTLAQEHARDALLNALMLLPEGWPLPVFYAGPPCSASNKDGGVDVLQSLLDPADGDLLPNHLFVIGGSYTSETPDAILDRVFQFFDEQPDLPLLALIANDDPWTRESGSNGMAADGFRDGYEVPAQPDTTVVLVFAHRERLDRLRHFTWSDPDGSFARQLRKAHTQALTQADAPSRKKAGPTVGAWQSAVTTFAYELRNTYRNVWVERGEPGLPSDWEPSFWLPLPWTPEQWAAFDGLPTLGYVSRAIPVPLQSVDDRTKGQSKRSTALRDALMPLLVERKTQPAWVIHTGRSSRLTEATLMKALGPTDPTGDEHRLEMIDLERNLGDTKAAAGFCAIALGLIASYRSGETALVCNQRPAEADWLTLIASPTADQRRTQQHPLGGDVFRHWQTPDLSMGELLSGQAPDP